VKDRVELESGVKISKKIASKHFARIGLSFFDDTGV
jgi:hypothetical protein